MRYERIIGLPHHTSRVRRRMPRENRAAQFAPYSALSGYEDAVVESARLTDKKIELDEYEKERINLTLVSLLCAPPDTRVSVTYFSPDKRKSGGAYITATGEVGRIYEYTKEITLIGYSPILFDTIIDIKIAQNLDHTLCF